MCRSLAASGCRVTYIVPTESNGEEAGVAIRALPPGRGPRRRISNLFRVLAAALRERGDVYHFHDPELLLVGVVLKLFGKRVIYDVHEDVPKQILTKYWIPRSLRRLVSRIAWCVEFVTSRLCDGIVTATPSIARKFPSRKMVVVQNFPLRHEIARHESTPFVERPANAIYVGGISVERGIHQVLAAMQRLDESVSAKLILAGVCQPASLAEELASSAASADIEFRGWCSRDQVQQMMASACAGIVTFLPLPNHVEAQPNKLFEYMSAGLPVIASDFPLWREIVEKNQCGLLVDPEEPIEIADAVAYLLLHPQEAEAMGRRGRQAVEERFNWDREAEVLVNFYARVLRKSSHERLPTQQPAGAATPVPQAA
jgi:glycosyltransferase involved in cell wall biosynthesis